MKKRAFNYFFAMIAVASVGALSSCGKDEIEPVVVPDPGIQTKSMVLLGNQLSSEKSFYSVADNVTYSLSEYKANVGKIDFGYGTGSATGNGNFIGSPADESMKAVYADLKTTVSSRTTSFMSTSVTKDDFDKISSDSAIVKRVSKGVATVPNSRVKGTDLEKGDVFAFSTLENKKGLVFVEEVGPSGSVASTIKITVKVQK